MSTALETGDSLDGVHWTKTAASVPPTRSLQGEIAVDVAIVGGGLTGTRTALGLAEAGASVALLEARSIGFGASGRSGGQCNPIWRATPDDLEKRLGPSCAERLVAATLTCADDLFSDIARFGIDCDAAQNGWIQAAHCKTAARSLRRLADAWNAVGGDIESLEGNDVAQRSGSEAYDFALFHKRGGHVHPLSLTRGFARVAAKLGAQLYENAPVQNMQRVGNKWKIFTPSGTVTAPMVVLATNGYTTDLWPGLRQTFLPMVSILLATAPLGDNLRESVLPGGVTISDSRRAIFYARYDRDHRLLFGCVGSDERVETLGGRKRLQKGLETVFPQLKDTPIETTWGGRIAVTPEMMPHLHAPADGVLAALGYSGRGIAMTSVMARSVVHKVLGGSDDEIPFPVTPLREIPLHRVATSMLPLTAPILSFRDSLDGLTGRNS
ncbi:MAG: FAD-binding oxidoreductase [Pseudomonadota bacterium]